MEDCKTTESDVCKKSPDLEKMSAAEVCDLIQKKTNEYDSVNKISGDVLGVISPARWIEELGKAINGKSSSAQNMINVVKMALETETYASQTSRCEGNLTQVQMNKINAGSPQCIDAISKSLTGAELLQYMKDLKVSGIRQENLATAKNECYVTAVLAALSSMDATIDNLALQESIGKATGLASKAEATQNVCNVVPIDMRACKYMNQIQCCKNGITQKQSNIINGCVGVSDVVQSNIADGLNRCILGAQSSISDSMKGSSKNSTKQSAVNEAEGLTMGALIVIMIIILMVLAAVFIGPTVLAGSVVKKMFIIMGPILCVIGCVFIVLFLFSIKKPSTRYNSPYININSTTTLDKDLDRDSYGNVKKRIEKSDVIGYDFFVDIPEDTTKIIDPAKITDATLGAVYYITNEPKAGAVAGKLEPPAKTVSYIKGKQNYAFLAIGIISLICGIIVTLYGIFKKSNDLNKPLQSGPIKPIEKAKNSFSYSGRKRVPSSYYAFE